ncbi:MAG: flagellar biosynthetic protein FliR [Thermodesulfobacteriota bacterium]
MISPNLFDWSIMQFQSFVLIMMRVSPILFMMPILSSSAMPNLLKISLMLAVSLLLLPLVKIDLRLFPSDPYQFGLFMIAELMVGFVLGLSINLIFAGIQLAGELAGYQMGLAMATILDPQSGMDTTLIAQFYYLLGLLIFLSIDGHHWFFRALFQSFSVLSPGEFHLKMGLYHHILKLSAKMFIIAIKMIAPIMAVLIFTQIALGMIAKMVPQMNVLMTSFPLTICLGLIFLGLSIELLVPLLKYLFEEASRGLVDTMLPLIGR